MPTILLQVGWLFVILFAQFFSSTLQYIRSNISVMVNDELRVTWKESTVLCYKCTVLYLSCFLNGWEMQNGYSIVTKLLVEIRVRTF